MRRLVALLLAALSTTVWADVPHRIEATYDIQVKGVKLAEVNEVFSRDGAHYQIQAITKPVGLLALFKPETIVVNSEGDIGPSGLIPLNFSHHRTHDTHLNNSAEFDWAQHELIHRDQGGIHQLPLNVGTQDRLSMMYQFVVAPPRGRLEMKFDMSNGSKVEVMHYQVKPEQTVTTSFGTMRSYYLNSLPLNVPKKSEVWLATEHNFMPCKIVFSEDGNSTLVQVLTDLKIVP